MAEKIVYEVGLDGVSAVVGNINTIQDALAGLHIPALGKQISSIYDELSKIPNGISQSLVHVERELAGALKKESKYVERLTREYEVLNVLRAKNIDVGGVGNSPTDRPNLFTTSKIFAANNSRTTWDHKYATYGVGPDGEFGATPVANGVLSHFAAEFQRAKNRASGDWGTIKQRARAFTESIFGKTVPLLTYDWKPGDKIYGAGNAFTTDNIFAANNSRTTWDHKYATYGVGPDGEFGATPVANGVLSHFAAEFQRAKNRASGDWGTIKQRARAFTESIFGKTVPLLTYDWKPGDKIYGAGNAFTTGVNNPNMDSPYYGQSPTRGANTKVIKEFQDAYYRKYKKWYAPTVWRGGAPAIVNPTGTALATLNNKYGIVDTGRVTDPGYVDADWSYVGAGSMSGARATALPGGSPKQLGYSGGALAKHVGNMIPPPSMLSRLMGLLGKLNAFATAVQAALRGVKFVIGAIKKFISGLAELGHALAQTSWRQLRESFAYGTSINSLARHERALANIGGDSASASALLGRWSSERSMLAYGGNGGSMMEAARLFGIGITGGGEYGFATNDEFTRNVIDAMTNATPERRNAIAGTLGLTPYQTWAFSHGQAYYDMLGRKSLSDFIMGDSLSEWDKKKSGDNARRFEGAWKSLKVSLGELANTLGDIVLPRLTIFIDLLSGMCDILNAMLKPISIIIQFVTNLFSVRWWQEFVGGTPTKEQNAMQMQAVTNNGKNVIINVGDVNMSSLPDNISTGDAAGKFASEIFDRLGELTINDRR